MTSTRHYVCGPRFDLFSANAYHNETVVGVASASAMAGTAHALARILAEESVDVTVAGLGIVVHASRFHEGMPRRHPDDRKSAAAGNASMVDDVLVDASVSLFLAIDLPEGAEPSDDEDVRLFDVVESVLEGGRLGGGMLLSVEDAPTTRRWARLDETAAIAWLAAAGDGHVLKDAHEDLALIAERRGGDMLDAIVHALRETDAGEGEYRPAEIPLEGGVYVPVAVGLAPIEDPVPRRARREGSAPHAYATSLTSLGRYVPIRRLAAAEKGEGLSRSAWNFRALGGDAAFVAVGT